MNKDDFQITEIFIKKYDMTAKVFFVFYFKNDFHYFLH